MRALVAGITGLAGSAVADELLASGHEVVGLARDPGRVNHDVPVVEGDVLTGAGLDEALTGVDVAYYMVHAIESGSGSPYDRDRAGAENFALAARRAGIQRVVYVGMYETPRAHASPHLRSRLEVERIILGAAPDSISLRAPLLVGLASSFLLFDRIISRCAVVPLGDWCKRRQAVIDPRDLARYLVAAGEAEAGVRGAFDLPPGEVVVYEALIRRMVAARGLRRVVVPLPFSDRRLSTLVGVLSGMGRTFARSLMTVPQSGEQIPSPDRSPPFGPPPAELRSLGESLRDLYAREASSPRAGTPASMRTARTDVEDLAAIERRAATAGEAASAQWLAGRLDEIGASDVELLPFRSPSTWAWHNGGHAALGLLASVLGARGRVLALAAAVSFEADYTGRSHWMRRLVPRGEGTSVTARIPAAGRPRRRVVVVAHHDAAHTGLVWTPAFMRGVRAQARRSGTTPSYIGLPLAGMLLIAVGGRRLRTAGRGVLGLMIGLAAQAGRSRTVPGANDNATGVAGALELARRFTAAPLADTEIVLLSPGAEEVGNGGMYAWMRQEAPKLDRASTLVVGLDAIGSGRPVLVARESVTGRYREEDLALAERAARDAGLADAPRVGLGAPTDCLLTTNAGFRTVSISSWDDAGIANLHLPTDTPENVDWHCVESAVELAEATIRWWAEEGPGDPGASRELGAALPSLGDEGQGWVALQGLLVTTVGASGLLGPRWKPSRVPRLAGVALASVGTGLMVGSMRALGESFTPNPKPKPDSALRRDSVFGYARHPIYGGIVLSSFGSALLFSPLALPPAAVLSGFLALKASREEALLQEQFSDYAAYRREVRRRFIPGLV